MKNKQTNKTPKTRSKKVTTTTTTHIEHDKRCQI